jgi:hypothetical protein
MTKHNLILLGQIIVDFYYNYAMSESQPTNSEVAKPAT